MTKFKNRNVFAAAIVAALLLGMFLSDANADLVSHWAFDEDAGATTAVASDTYYNATPSNGVTFGSTGVFGNAVHFDGTASNNLAFRASAIIYTDVAASSNMDCIFCSFSRLHCGAAGGVVSRLVR